MLTVVKQTRTLVCFVIMFQDHLGRPREKIWCQKTWLEKRMSSPFWNHTRNRRHNRHVIEQNTIFWSPYVCWALDRSARVLQCFEGLWLYFALFVVLTMCIRSGGAGAQVYIHYEGIHTYRSLAYVFLFFALAKKKKEKESCHLLQTRFIFWFVTAACFYAIYRGHGYPFQTHFFSLGICNPSCP